MVPISHTRGTYMKKFLLMTALPLLATASIIGTGFAAWSFGSIQEQDVNGAANVEIGSLEDDFAAGTLSVDENSGSKLVLDQEKTTSNPTVTDVSKDSTRKGVHWEYADGKTKALAFNYDYTGLTETDYVEYTITINVSANLAKYVEFEYKGAKTSADTTKIKKSFLATKTDSKDVFFSMDEVTVKYISSTYPSTKAAYNQMKTDLGSDSKIDVSVHVEGATVSESIVNGDFETGNMTGWSKISGNVPNTKNPSNQTIYNQNIDLPYNKSGTYFLGGFGENLGDEEKEKDLWEVKSTYFKLDGSGYITYKMGGNAASLNVYNAKTGKKIANYINKGFVDNCEDVTISRNVTMITYVADLSGYVGETLYITLEDNKESDWGIACYDDIVTYNSEAITITNQKDHIVQGGTEYDVAWMEAVNTVTA